MKIAYIISNPSLTKDANTGYGRHIRAVFHGLIALGHEVEIYELGNSQTTTNQIGEAQKTGGVTQVLKKIIPPLLWETVKDVKLLVHHWNQTRRLIRSLKMNRPDIVLERGSYLSWVGHAVCKRLDIPLVLEVNAPFSLQRVEISGNSLLEGIGRIIERRNYQSARAVQPVSRALAEYIHEHFDVSFNKLFVNHNGTDRGEFEDVQDSGEFTIGFVGSIMRYHGINDLIRLSEQLESKQIEHRVMIVGDGQSIPSLKAELERLGLDSKWQFTGSVEHGLINTFLNQMDVCVLPSTKWYCSPIKLFEYGLSGKAIVAKNEPCVEEILVHGKEGLLFSNYEEFESAVIQLKNDLNMRRELGEKFKQKVLNEFLWEHNIDRIEQAMHFALRTQQG